jgi:hypothetical protein
MVAGKKELSAFIPHEQIESIVKNFNTEEQFLLSSYKSRNS